MEKQPRIRLLADRVAVLPVEKEDFKKNGIIIPSALAEKKNNVGVLVAISQKITNEAKDWEKVELGEQVLYSEYAGSPIEVDGQEYQILRITDVICVLEPAKK